MSDNSMIITLHSSGMGSRRDNRADDFICPLPSELKLDPHKNYKVCLLQLMCDLPIVASKQGYTGKELVHVCLKQIDPLHCDEYGLISTHEIDTEIVDFSRRYGKYGDDYTTAGNVHVFEPKHKRFFPLISTKLDSFHVVMLDRRLRYLYRPKQAVTSSTVVLELKEMEDYNKQEIVPLTLKSDSQAELFPDNTASDFRLQIPSRFNNQTRKPWFVALSSITYPTKFSLFPGNLRTDQSITIARNLPVDTLNSIEYKMNKPVSMPHYRIDEETGNIGFAYSLDSFGEIKNKLDLITELRRILKWYWPPKREQHHVGIIINDDELTTPNIKEGEVSFYFKTDWPDTHIELCYGIAVLLGMVKFIPFVEVNTIVRVRTNHRYVQPLEFDTWYHPRKLFLYCNFVEPSINGSVFSPLLAVIPVQHVIQHNVETVKNFASYEATQLTYRKLSTQNLSECRIEIRDEFGGLVRFREPDKAVVFIDLFVQVNK